MNKFLAKFKIELNEFGYRTVLTPKTMTTRRRGKPPPGAGGQPLFGKTQEIHLIWWADAALTLINSS